MEIKTDDPEAIAKIMKGFEEIWPKIIFFDPEIKPWYNLLQNVYAQGMMTTFQYIREQMEEEPIVPDVTIH
tara:strand:+ start:1168 stop:1380 length:213 start_codon:yes stop_codon:yes gene_type:complete